MENLKTEYDRVCTEWIAHEDIREEILGLLMWWVERDDRLRGEVARLAGEVYRGEEE